MTTVRPEPIARDGDGAEAVRLVAGNLSIGARLGAAATTFVFFCPFFAYFYLRSLNSAGMFHPAGIQPPERGGAAIMVLFVASAGLLVLAARAASERGWKTLLAGSLVVGLVGVALQCIEYASIGFGPMSGGYASVYIAWTALAALFALATMFWVETLLAYLVRNPGAPPAVVRPRLSALAFYWAFVSGLGVVMWIVLYLV